MTGREKTKKRLKEFYGFTVIKSFYGAIKSIL